jgi:hypothetical protein
MACSESRRVNVGYPHESQRDRVSEDKASKAKDAGKLMWKSDAS